MLVEFGHLELNQDNSSMIQIDDAYKVTSKNSLSTSQKIFKIRPKRPH